MSSIAAAKGAPAERGGFAAWFLTGLPPELKFVYFVLLANGVPAFLILLSLPDRTESWFVWTIEPPASARLLAVMYGNALTLVVLGFVQGSWHGARITLVVVAFFSVAATIGTFFQLRPFLSHPPHHLLYWLTMYLVLLATAPMLLVVLLRRYRAIGAPRVAPLTVFARAVAAGAIVLHLLIGAGLLARRGIVYDHWPWPLAPIDGGMIGVWFVGLALAYAWALWDGDWLRTRPIYWQALPTGITLAFIPVVHADELRDDAGDIAIYAGLAVGSVAVHALVVARQQLGSAGRALAFLRGPAAVDVAVLVLAGVINSIISPVVAELVLADGLEANVRELETRMAWVADHGRQWQWGWTAWFAVTVSFAASYYALGRNLRGNRQLRELAIGLAIIAAAIDIAGLVVNITVLPHLAERWTATGDAALLSQYSSFEALANDAIYIVSFGLYSVAGLLLVPPAFQTASFPRLLAWLGLALWSAACIATALLALDAMNAGGPLSLSFLLFAPWAWGGAWWVLRGDER